MEHFTRLTVDNDERIARVEAGATWADLQRVANDYELAVIVMQASNIFTIGGSLSVNCHGWAHNIGPLANTIRSLTIVDAQGQLRVLDPKDELFSFVVGGFGGFGIIVEVEIALIENRYLRQTGSEVSPEDYVEHFYENIWLKDEIPMHLYRLSLNPKALFESGIAIDYLYGDGNDRPSILRDEPVRGKRLERIELHILRRFKTLLNLAWKIERRDALKGSEGYRNELMRPPINPASNHSKVDAEWLQEFFIKGEDLARFLSFLAKILMDNEVAVLNASVRFVPQDDLAKLAYSAKGNRFAIVLYFNQSLIPEAVEQTKKWIRQVIDYLIARGGSYYLPYQHFATSHQFRSCYPNWKQVADAKKRFDSNQIFSNGFLEDYLFANQKNLNHSTDSGNKMTISTSNQISPQVDQFLNEQILNKSPVNSLTRRIYQGPTPVLGKESHFKAVLKEGGQREEVKAFLRNVFMQVQEPEFFENVDDILQQSELNDDIAYSKLSEKLKKCKGGMLKSGRAALRSLKALKKDLSSQVGELMGRGRLIDGYLEIGYPGRLIRPLRQQLKLKGPMIVVNERESIIDLVDAGFPRPYGQFIPFDNYSSIKPCDVPDASLDLVTCFIGLHHSPQEKIVPFIDSIERIIRPGGSFVLMEHNAHSDDLKRLIFIVHTVFNAATGISEEAEKGEIRNFHSLDYWSGIIESRGFKRDLSKQIIRKGDSSLNTLMRFQKQSVSQGDIEIALDKTPGYQRQLMQTYLTAPEWCNVRATRAYADFIQHTPFFKFPFFEQVGTFWRVFGHSWSAARQYNSFKEVATSEYTIMNLFIGATMTAEFAAKGLISFPVNLIYGDQQQRQELETLHLLVDSGERDLLEIDERIEVLETFSSTGLQHIQIPRYSVTAEILSKFAKNRVHFINIAGQKRIQIDALVDRETTLDLPADGGCKILYVNQSPEDRRKNIFTLDVKVDRLGFLLQKIETEGHELAMVHDF